MLIRSRANYKEILCLKLCIVEAFQKSFHLKKNAENDKKERKPKKQKLRLTFYQV